MKRLTISMSDTLFEKLNQVENKSLFIRKLIEGELHKGITQSADTTYECLVGDIEDLHHEIHSLSSRLISIEKQMSDLKANPTLEKSHFDSHLRDVSSLASHTIIPEENRTEVSNFSDYASLSNLIDDELVEAAGKELPLFADESPIVVSNGASDIAITQSSIEGHEQILSKHTGEIENMPSRSVISVGVQNEDISNVIATNEGHLTSAIAAHDLADEHEVSFAVPASNASIPSSLSFVMPELSDISEPASASPFEIPPAISFPSSGSDLQISSSAAANGEVPGIQIQNPPFMMPEMQASSFPASATIQPKAQESDRLRTNTSGLSVNERLQGNILMYLPHGARIKKSIIKGLVSKKFSAEEIDNQIKSMVSGRSLLVEAEDGVEYLLRP